MMMSVLSCAASYLIGSVPTGLILGKRLWGVDLRKYGSHNIGATNAWRTLGKGPGTLVFLLDMLKGVIGVALGMWASGGDPLVMMLGGICAVAGHCASVFLSFSGGKGVATGLGVILMLMPKATVAVFLLWLTIVLATRYVSLGSIVAALSVPIFAYLTGAPWLHVAFTALLALYVVWRHRENINRLRTGTESKIRAGHRS